MEHAGPQAGPQTIQAAFERQVAHSPNDTAVVEALDSSYRLSYRELSNAAKQLARKLVCATAYAGERSEQQPNAGCTDVGAVAAVLVNGSVERMALVQPVVLLLGSTDGAPLEIARECCCRLKIPVLSLADDAVRLCTLVAAGPVSEAQLPAPNPVAHIIFTSGTSGHPKAVFCHHRGSLLSHTTRIAATRSYEARTRTTTRDPYVIEERQTTFGCGVFGIWDAVAAHLHGDIAVMFPDAALRDAEQLAALIAVNDVDQMLITPTLLDNLLSNAAGRAGLSLLKSVTLCGELPSANLVARAVALLPSTTALGSGQFALEPLPHVKIWVVDEDGRPLPEGCTGSILVGGNALAGGYLGISDSHADEERLIELAATGDRVCRTGDKACVNVHVCTDGSFDSCSSSRSASADTVSQFTLVGREDDAVKVRGYLVATAAVEAAFMQCYAADAKACVVVTMPEPTISSDAVAGAAAASTTATNSCTEIGMAVVWNDDDDGSSSGVARPTATDIRSMLATVLPPAAIPLHIVELDALPVDSLAGKCDRRGVQQLIAENVNRQPGELVAYNTRPAVRNDLLASDSSGEYIRMVQRAMAQVLQLPSDSSMQPEDDFFRAGGHSVAAVRLCNLLDCRIADLIGHSTPSRLAHHLQFNKTGDSMGDTPPVSLHRHVKLAEQLAQAETSVLPQHRLQELGNRSSRSATAILLTGATGALGSQLLRDFLLLDDIGEHKEIVCLVRAADDRQALGRIKSSFEMRRIRGHTGTVITAIAGDVAAPLLGLSPDSWLALANKIGAVVHAAAVVDRFAPLSALLSANVHATARLTHMATLTGAAMHFISSSAALPPVGTTAGNAAAHWPPRGGRWAAALEGSLHTQDIHGGVWEGYAQSKWICEQIVSRTACVGDDPVPQAVTDQRSQQFRGGTAIIHRFGSLANDPDTVAVLSASIVAGALPSSITSVEWLDLEVLSAQLVDCVVHELAKAEAGTHREFSDCDNGTVRHYSCRCEDWAICQKIAQRCEIPELERVSTAEWRAKIQQAFVPAGATGAWNEQQLECQGELSASLASLRDSVKDRVLTLTYASSGLEGAIGLCERPLQS